MVLSSRWRWRKRFPASVSVSLLLLMSRWLFPRGSFPPLWLAWARGPGLRVMRTLHPRQCPIPPLPPAPHHPHHRPPMTPMAHKWPPLPPHPHLSPQFTPLSSRQHPHCPTSPSPRLRSPSSATLWSLSPPVSPQQRISTIWGGKCVCIGVHGGLG